MEAANLKERCERLNASDLKLIATAPQLFIKSKHLRVTGDQHRRE